MAEVAKATLDDKLNVLVAKFKAVNDLYIEKIAEQINAIGELNATSIHRLTVMAQTNANMLEVSAELAKACRIAMADLADIYRTALEDVKTDPRFAQAVEQRQFTDTTNARLRQLTEAVSRQTMGTIQNLSNTTIFSPSYRQAIDKAVLAGTSGVTDYKSAVRDVIKQVGYSGMQIHYPSGYHRRLDTAVRQNVINGINQIAQQSSMIMGEALGYDAVEISAHARSAPDHEPVQGRVFLMEEYKKMQNGDDFVDVDGRSYAGFRRPIGEWNCMHLAMSFDTRTSVRKFTDKQLEDFKEKNAEGCEVNGKKMSLYRAGQLMRQIETEVRRQKDVRKAAKLVEDKALEDQCNKRIDALVAYYKQVSTASGIRQRKDRMTID